MKRRNILILLLLFVVTMTIACTKAADTAPEKPDEIYNPEIVAVTSYSTNIKLEWESLSGVSKYEVRYAETEDMENATALESNVASIDIKNLQKSHSYYFQIRASTSEGWTDWSNVNVVNTATFEAAVTTYNILGIEADPVVEPEFAWHLRKDALKSMILQSNNNADLVAFQETRELADELSEMLQDHYECHVSEREVSARVIAWKPEKFELVSYDDDIDIFGTEVTGQNTARYPTHVRLKEIESGKEILVYNVHVPAGTNLPREEAQRIRSVGAQKLAAYAKQKRQETGLPVIIMGDFNGYPETVIDGHSSACIIMKEEGLEDTFDKALERTNINYATTVNRATSSVKPGQNGSSRIDYIFTYPSTQIAVTTYDILINFEAGSSSRLQKPVPSDHHPVRSVLYFTY